MFKKSNHQFFTIFLEILYHLFPLRDIPRTHTPFRSTAGCYCDRLPGWTLTTIKQSTFHIYFNLLSDLLFWKVCNTPRLLLNLIECVFSDQLALWSCEPLWMRWSGCLWTISWFLIKFNIQISMDIYDFVPRWFGVNPIYQLITWSEYIRMRSPCG